MIKNGVPSTDFGLGLYLGIEEHHLCTESGKIKKVIYESQFFHDFHSFNGCFFT